MNNDIKRIQKENYKMKSLSNTANMDDKRLLNIREAAAYIGQGTTKTRAWLDSIGAKRKFGSRALYDRRIIDEALDNYMEG